MRKCVDFKHGLLEVDVREGKHGFVMLCHAHPKFGGTMDHKVLTTTMRVIEEIGYTAVRFNYRGVGKSTGSYGDIFGEIEDAESVKSWACDHYGPCVAVVGYSFGAFIAWSIRSGLPALLIAPSTEKMPYRYNVIGSNCTVVLAGSDEICPADEAYDWANSCGCATITIEQACHFFHNKLKPLSIAVHKFVSAI